VSAGQPMLVCAAAGAEQVQAGGDHGHDVEATGSAPDPPALVDDSSSPADPAAKRQRQA
jgi:hypothetical protein